MAETQPTHRELLSESQLAEMASFMIDNPQWYADSDDCFLVGSHNKQTLFFVTRNSEEIEQWAEGYDISEEKLRRAFLQAWKDLPNHSDECDKREGFVPAAGDDIVAFELGLLVANNE
jgi:hypothetical protein